MKTFFVLFVIAASLPVDAQRVKENIRQRVEIVGEEQVVAEQPVSEPQAKPKGVPKVKPEKPADAVRKQ